MRPASEINSALELAQQELERTAKDTAAVRDDMRDPDDLTEAELDAQMAAIEAWQSIQLVRDVLAWVMGGRIDHDAPNSWLCAYLLDDPPKLDDTDPRTN